MVAAPDRTTAIKRNAPVRADKGSLSHRQRRTHVLATTDEGLRQSRGGIEQHTGGHRATALAMVEHANALAHAIHLVAAVRDEHHAPGKRAERVSELELELPAQVTVERAEGFIEKEERRIVRHDAREGATLLLATRQLGRTQALKALQAEGSNLLQSPLAALVARSSSHACHDIVENRHRREQRVVLKEIAHAPILHRHVNARSRVKQHATVQNDTAPVGALDTGDALERHTLAAAGRTENRKRLARVIRIEGHVEDEVAKAFCDVNEKAHARLPCVRTLPSSQFMARRTTADMATLTRTHRNASASSPVRHS